MAAVAWHAEHVHGVGDVFAFDRQFIGKPPRLQLRATPDDRLRVSDAHLPSRRFANVPFASACTRRASRGPCARRTKGSIADPGRTNRQ